MDVKELIRNEFICWEDVQELGMEERIAVIIGKPERITAVINGKEITKLLFTLQLSHSKEIVKFRSNKRTLRNLAKEYGYNSDDWLAKVVKLESFRYPVNNTGLMLVPWQGFKPKDKLQEMIDNIINRGEK